MIDTDAPIEPGKAKPYLEMITASVKSLNMWQTTCDSIEKQYANLAVMKEVVGDRQFRMFWANMEVLRPTIYARPPVPVVAPRFNNRDPLVLKASEVLERAITYDVESDDLHASMCLARDDLALCGRGVLWVLDNGACIHVRREDFCHDMARSWREVEWVARRAHLSREEGLERFGEVFRKIERKDDDDRSTKKAQVWEMWHRSENQVIWLAEGCEDILESSEPLVDVEGFFPCPRPASATLEPSTLKPVPDFIFYRDQLDEINELTARISKLSESLRMKGFYASGVSEVGEAIEAALAATDDKAILVPVSNFAALGGASLKDSIIWLPVQEVANVVQQLVSLRQQIIQDVYEITGLSDIMRGSTDANETLGAQKLKSQYGSVRVRERQAEMVRVGVGVLRLKAEIYAETIPASELLAMAQITDVPTMAQAQQSAMQAQMQGQPPAPPPAVTVEAIDELLKSQKMRAFALEIETDSTIAPDEEAEKTGRIEFLGAISNFIAMAGPMVAAQPETAGFAAAALKFVAGGFRAGRELAPAIDEFAEQVKQKAQQPPPEAQPDPMAAKAQADAQAAQAKLQFDVQAKQADMQMKQSGMAQDAQLSREKMQMDFALKREEIAMRREGKGAETMVKVGGDEGQMGEALMQGLALLIQSIQAGQASAAEAQMVQTNALIGEIQRGNQGVVAAMLAPKQVIRDAEGRAVGVQTVGV